MIYNRLWLPRCESSTETQGKPDDIQVLEKKLRSLFMDLGGAVPSADILASDPASGAHAAGTSSPIGPPSTSSTSVTTPGSSLPTIPPQPPSSLVLGSPAAIQGPGTPVSTPAQIGKKNHVKASALSFYYFSFGHVYLLTLCFQFLQSCRLHLSARPLHPNLLYPGYRWVIQKLYFLRLSQKFLCSSYSNQINYKCFLWWNCFYNVIKFSCKSWNIPDYFILGVLSMYPHSLPFHLAWNIFKHSPQQSPFLQLPVQLSALSLFPSPPSCHLAFFGIRPVLLLQNSCHLSLDPV